MGFLDAMKKGANLAKKGLDMVDETLKKKVARMSDDELREILDKNPNSKYAREEANKRGI